MSLGLPKPICFGVSSEMAGILVNLYVYRVNDFSAIISNTFNVYFERFSKDPSVSPSEVKSINGIPKFVFFWQLIPIRTGDQNPPNSIYSFSTISWLPFLFLNVRRRNN